MRGRPVASRPKPPRRTPRAFACASAAFVRCEIRLASSSATADIWITMNFPTGPGGIWGRSQKTTPPSPEPSITESRSRTLRLRRSSLATRSVAFVRRQSAKAWARAGRSLSRPLSTSTNSLSSFHRPPSRKRVTSARCASRPSPLWPCWSVETRREEQNRPKAYSSQYRCRYASSESPTCVASRSGCVRLLARARSCAA